MQPDQNHVLLWAPLPPAIQTQHRSVGWGPRWALQVLASRFMAPGAGGWRWGELFPGCFNRSILCTCHRPAICGQQVDAENTRTCNWNPGMSLESRLHSPWEPLGIYSWDDSCSAYSAPTPFWRCSDLSPPLTLLCARLYAPYISHRAQNGLLSFLFEYDTLIPG